MKKVLHLSHHYGCLKDHQYICDQLNLDLTNMFSIWDKVIPKNCFNVTKEVANTIWNTHKDYFNSYDYVLVSDTSPLSRIILENISEFSGTLIVWICNRFNYEMNGDAEYHELFARAVNFDNVRIIPYTEFERVWAKHFNINITEDTIRPIGLSTEKPLSEFEEQGFLGYDNIEMQITEGDVLVSRYHNDNIFQSSSQLFNSYNLTSDVAKYRGYNGLCDLAKTFQCYFILPEQYSKLVAFELMNIGMPVILPSERFLLQLSRIPNYWFGSGINQHTIHLCEWYNEYYDKFALYIDDFSDIPDAFNTIVDNKTEICNLMQTYSKIHQEKTIQQWRTIYNV